MADDALRSAPDAGAQVEFTLFMLPLAAGACDFTGVGWVGCLEQAAAANLSASAFCKSWVRTASATTIVHELGHNLGLMHAALDADDDGAGEDDYGDGSCAMGHTELPVGINGPHRLAMGWLPPAAVYDTGARRDGRAVLRCLSRRPDGSTGSAPLPAPALPLPVFRSSRARSHSALQIPRHDGGHYLVTFRAATIDSGFDGRGLVQPWRGSVLLNHMTGPGEPSHLIATLGPPGGTRPSTHTLAAVGGGLRLSIVSIDRTNGVAVVVYRPLDSTAPDPTTPHTKPSMSGSVRPDDDDDKLAAADGTDGSTQAAVGSVAAIGMAMALFAGIGWTIHRRRRRSKQEIVNARYSWDPAGASDF